MSEIDVFDFFLLLGGQPLVNDIKATEKAIKELSKRYGKPRSAKPQPWQQHGAVQQVTPTERGAVLRCERGQVELVWTADDCLRVRSKTTPGDFAAPFSYAVVKTDWNVVSVEVNDGVDVLEMRSASLLCRVQKKPFRLSLHTLDGQTICGDGQGIGWREDGSVRLSLGLTAAESSYGVAERATQLMVRGKRFALWNTDQAHYKRDIDPLYYTIPFYLGLREASAYGIFWDNSHRGTVDIGAAKKDELAFEAEGGDLCFYLFGAADFKRILTRYTELTGRINLPPLWSLGYQQCRFSYFPDSEVLEIADGFRKRNIPCDVIYLDIHYMDGFRVFTWNKDSFPDPKGLIDKLHAKGFKVITIVDPGIKIDPKFEVYQSGIAADVYLKYPDGDPVRAPVWPGMCHFPDFTRPATRAWWVEQSKRLLELGVDGFWNDMCEPAIFSSGEYDTLPDFVRHDREGLGGSHLEAHNVYGMQMGRASLEALDTHRPGKRQVNIIRAGFAGAQRYASSWTGDNTSDWDHLKLSIPMALSMGLCGAPITGPDVGGFSGEGEGELLTRWLQAACLMPYYRGHTGLNTAYQEPWAFGSKYEAINRATIGLRYQLLPYLYSVVAQAAEYGLPIVRPLFMGEPNNPALRGIDDCYMLGDAVLVAPVLEKGATQRKVTLPAGVWYDFWTSVPIAGGQTVTIRAPLERLPLFVRAGTVLPMYPVMQHTGEQPVSTLTLRIYPGVFETILYEDAGEGLGYRQGDYRWVYMTCSVDGSKLFINRRTAGRYEPPYTSLRIEVALHDEEPSDIKVDRRPAPVWFFEQGLLEFTIDKFSAMEITRVARPNDPTVFRRPKR